MVDIREQMSLAESTPQDAAQHIDNARLFDIPAPAYKENKEYLAPAVNNIRKPTSASPIVSQYISNSPEHASLVSNDVERLSHVEGLFTQLGTKINGGKTLDQQITELSLKKQNDPGNFTQEDSDKLFQLNEDAKDLKDYGFKGPNKHQELIDQSVSIDTREPGIGEKLYNALGAGMANVNSSIAKAPQLAYDAYFLPANLLRMSRGEELITAPDGLKDNLAVKHYEEAAQQFSEKVPELTQSISENVGKGEFAQAGKVAALQLVTNAPNQMALLMASVTGAGAAGLIGAGISSAASANYENQKKGLSPLQSVPNALAKGSFEAGLESMGTLGLMKTWEKALIESYGKESAKQVMKNTFKTMVATAAGEGTEEAATSIAQDITDWVSGVNPDALKGIGKRALDAGLIGAASGVAMTTPTALTSAIAKVETKPKTDLILQTQEDGTPKTSTLHDKSIKALEVDQTIDNILAITKESEVQKLAPAEVTEIRKNMLSAAGIKAFFIDKLQLKEFAKTPEKLEEVVGILGPVNQAIEDDYGFLKIDAHKFIEAQEQYPTLAELRKLQPEDPSMTKAQEFLKAKSEADKKRAAILESLGTKPLTGEERATIEGALNPNIPEMEVLKDTDYLYPETFSEAVKKIMPNLAAQKYNDAQQEVRQKVYDTVEEAAVYEMNQVKDVNLEIQLEIQKEIEEERIRLNPNVIMVERFASGLDVRFNKRFPDLASLTANHYKQGYSPLAIDPRSLPENLKEFEDNAQLKKHKVFVKGGITADDAAALLGVPSGEELIRTLAITPSRQDIIDARLKKAEVDLQKKVDETTDLSQTMIIKNLNDSTRIHLEEIKVLLSDAWPAARDMIRRIGKSLPTDQTLRTKAKYAIDATKLSDLNVNQFKIAERKAQAAAIDAITRNEVEQAINAKLAAAQNVELARATLLANGKVNQTLKFLKKFRKAETIQELKDAGTQYYDAVNEILKVFNLALDEDSTTKAGSFNKWAERIAKEGEGDFSLPEAFDPLKQNLDELTVEQTLMLGEKLRNVLHIAKTKNRLYKKFDKIKGYLHIEREAAKLAKIAEQSFDYDESRYDKSFLQKASVSSVDRVINNILNDPMNFLERQQHLLVKLDDGMISRKGGWQETLYHPIRNGSNGEKNDSIQVRDEFLKIIKETIGEKEFQNMASDIVTVEEFKQIKALKDGEISKLELLQMLLNMGNESNIVALERFGLSRGVFTDVLQKHLDRRHMVFAQRIWDIFASFKDRMIALEKETTGEDVNFIEATPLQWGEEVFLGGYYPIQTQFIETKYRQDLLIGSIDRRSQDNWRQNMYASAMTDRGHLMHRTSSKDVLDLSFGFGKGISRIIHDLNMRIPIRDAGKLLSNENIQKSMISVIGVQGYQNVSDAVLAHVTDIENRITSLDNSLVKFINHVAKGKQITSIVGKGSSILIQTASLPVALARMGFSSVKHMRSIVTKISSNPTYFPSMLEFAARIHPNIRATREDLEGDIVNSIREYVPQRKARVKIPLTNKDIPGLGTGLNLLSKSQLRVLRLGFGALSKMDQFNKTVVVLTAFSQAINGDVEHIKAGDHEAAAKYASDIVELTQTANDIRNLSPIQREASSKWATFFFSDMNNYFNNVIAVARDLKRTAKKTGQAIKKGEGWEAVAIADAGLASFMFSMAMFTTIKIIENAVRGVPQPFDDDEKDPEKYLKNVSKYLLTTHSDLFISSLPILRDIDYASDKYWMRKKDVEMPLEQAFGSFATTLSGVKHYLDNKEVTEQEEKSLWSTSGILLHLPTESFYKYFLSDKALIKMKTDGLLKDTSSSIETYLKKNPDAPEAVKEDLKQLQNQIDPAPEDEFLVEPKNLNVLKQTISKGDWTKENEKTGAVGVYQFTDKAWQDIKGKAPELGLTDDGRLSSNSEQQEKAMTWLMEENAKQLKTAGLEVTNENLYASKILTIDKAIKVLQSTGDTKIKSLVGDEKMQEFGFKNSMKVREFKDWLFQQTAEAELELEGIDKTNK